MVLEGDLYGAVMYADEANLAALHDIVLYVIDNVPADGMGSKEAVRSWLARTPAVP